MCIEASADQFANTKNALIVRIGWMSFERTQIFEAGGFASQTVVGQTSVVMARLNANQMQSPYVPTPMEEYEMIYARFAELLKSGKSDTDVRPLQLICDCFMLGRPKLVDAFID